MAKILTGPLASGITGSIGNLTFAQTRFGQVVQSRPVPPVYTSGPGLATKNRFRLAMRSMTEVYNGIIGDWRAEARKRKQTATHDWVSTWIRLIQTNQWATNYASFGNIWLSFDYGYYVPGSYFFRLNASGDYPDWAFALLQVKDGVVNNYWNGYPFNWLYPQSFSVTHSADPPPCTWIAIPQSEPHYAHDFGRSAGIYIP
jgi:hypothetical protein